MKPPFTLICPSSHISSLDYFRLEAISQRPQGGGRGVGGGGGGGGAEGGLNSSLNEKGRVETYTSSTTPELHPHGDVTAPVCRIDADVPRHNGGTQHTTDDGVSVRVGLEFLQEWKQKKTDHSRAGSGKPVELCLEYLHLSVFLVLVEGDVVLAVGDIVFLHPVITFGARFWCSPLCVDSRHPGLIPKVHLQPLVAILCSGQPRAYSHVGAVESQPGVRGPKIDLSFRWGGDLTVQYSSALHTQRLGALLGWGRGK